MTRYGALFFVLIVTLIGISLSSYPACAQTKITKAQAQKFYTGCISNALTLQGFTPIQRDYFCTCTAVKMEQNLSTEDVRGMSETKTKEGRAALVKMLEQVQFPCIMRPLADNIRDECVKRASANPQFAAGGKKYCGCLADQMMSYVKKVGVSETLYRINMTGEVRDPMEALRSGSGYSNELIRNYYSCFGGALP